MACVSLRVCPGVGGTALGLICAVQVAHAGPCSSLPNPIVIESGDTQEPLLKTLGRQLRDTATPMTVIYRTAGTCTVRDDLFQARKIAANTNLFYPPSTAEDPAWDPSKPSAQCTVDGDAGGLAIDLGIGATFLSSCSTAAPPAGIGLTTGPVMGYGFIVPKASTQRAITAEEGYFVFGFGDLSQAPPWTDHLFMFTRPATKSTALSLAACIGVPAGKLQGVPYDKSAEVLNAVAISTNPEKTIGLMGIEIYDNNRDKVSLLAFKAFKQRYAYFPDSTPTSFDKRNLRDGHYVPWAPTIYITAADANNVPTNANAKLFIDLVLGNTTLPGVDGLVAGIKNGLVPDCAMGVTRAYDGGDLSLYSPAAPCGCYYESKVPNGSSTCTPCTDDTPCNGGKCRFNFCEAR
jgi:hypothetical protein